MKKYLSCPLAIMLILASFNASTATSKSKQFNLNCNLLEDSITYSAKTSTTISKDKQKVTLVGNAQFQCKNFKITAHQIIFDKKLQKLYAENYIAYDENGQIVKKGVSGEFNIDKKI